MDSSSTNLKVVYTGTLEGHKGPVTCIAAPSTPEGNFVLTGSRDKSLIQWELIGDRDTFAMAKKSFHGHNHFVSDVSLSADGKYAVSASWDKTLRLWNLESGKTEATFVGHTHDVMSVAFSPDNMKIISAGRDKNIKIWNTQGQIKGDFASGKGQGHTEWISSIRFSPDNEKPKLISCGWDKLVKIWDMSSEQPALAVNHIGHTGVINSVAISPDGSLCSSGGKDGTVMLWDLNEPKHLYSLDAGDVIHTLLFCPNRYWLCAATETSIKIWDLLSKTIVDDLRPEFPIIKSGKVPHCLSLAWSADGSTLFSGYTDGKVRVWQVSQRSD